MSNLPAKGGRMKYRHVQYKEPDKFHVRNLKLWPAPPKRKAK